LVASIVALIYGLAGAHTFISFGIPFALAFQVLLVAPIFEEVILRGIYLRVFVGFLGKNDLSALFGVIISSLVFGYIHADLMSVKVLGGIVLACIYLYKWRGNLVACVLAHFSVNLFIVIVTFATGAS
jgi:membrane protease YdiL (CAAX protease family)